MSLSELFIRTLYGQQDPAPPAAQPSAAPGTPGKPEAAPAHQPTPPEHTAAVTAPRTISGLCDTGGHYDCQRCGCGCHPPQDPRST